ncbi:pyridoxamine 5'-phosphate oxidase family protein [Nocardia goodfellowii]|uniref:Nitroimidazol reductase NimA-like FMN-containing flavoprotein (Pyridoxamine 5'-phosphate oxidase superfamily) n=1 Tax=Nocardia goodfellowii TaxID=882446 RepID=A0ABS4QN48_9NOCA|nr:pyridoxamine 5'-phosphate oxidase family protein [Nocardia goodfellowii]MBP2193131.1 nitroimidazol reductase NimA-like FMN-containing flavoprotein (pyridoxamine 5'-phosphate oxidase superfamily) [Nocardia goodfellowii]
MPGHFSEAERQDFLAAEHVAVLSVAATDDRPPASVPMWYDYVPGGDIRIVSRGSGRRAELIEKARAVTLVVQREQPPYQYVIVEGTVVDIVQPAPARVREDIAVRYLGEDAGREFVRKMDETDAVAYNTLYTVRPDRWCTADYSEE